MATETKKAAGNGGRKKWIWIAAAALLLALLAGGALWLSAQAKRGAALTEPEAAVSAQPTAESVTGRLSVSGPLTAAPAEPVTVPEGVDTTSLLVRAGDMVSAGDRLALVDHDSVVVAAAALQEKLAELDGFLGRAKGDAVQSYINAGAAGRVMAIYAQKGQDVTQVMAENGALALLSLDGLLRVDFPASEEMTLHQRVVVRTKGDKDVEGRVERLFEGVATVTFPDDAALPGETVTVLDQLGLPLGEGQVAIHSELKVTGYLGTVGQVYTRVGARVNAGATLLTLTNTDYDGAYDTLLATRHKMEEQMLSLFQLYQDNALYAPYDGTISSVETLESGLTSTLAAGADGGYSLLAANPPDAPSAPAYDDTWQDVVALVTDVSFGAFTVQYYFGAVADYTQTPDMTAMTPADATSSLSPGCAVFAHGDSGWALSSLNSIKAGDVLILTFADTDADGLYTPGTDTLQWIVRTAAPELPDEPVYYGGGEPAAFTYVPADHEVLRISPAGAVTVAVSVDEQDVRALEKGQTATVVVDALGSKEYPGVVTAIDPVGVNRGGSTKFAVEVSLEQADGMLPGMNASVVVSLAQRENVLTLPVAALQEAEGRVFVYTGYDAKNHTYLDPVEVETGLSDGQLVEILSGLTENDTVWYAYRAAAVVR